MEIPREMEDYIRESIDHTVGLPVSTTTLQLKLAASEQSLLHLRQQYLSLAQKLKLKDDIIERSKAEASMNAVALKKFVEENQKLAAECANLLAQCKRWERECSLYDHDREALMDFGNEADERAKEAEVRVLELEEEVKRLSEEVQFYKYQCEAAQSVGTSTEESSMEHTLLESLLTNVIGTDEVAPIAHAFLEANNGVEVCQKMLSMWDRLRPATKKVLALVAEVKALENDKENLRINLYRAEDEVKVLAEENNLLDEENKKLIRLRQREKHTPGSGGKHSASASAKGSKRKSSPKMSSPVEKKIDFGDGESIRHALSPLRHNSPESRMQKK